MQDKGGWLNPDVADWFEYYAEVCFRELGDQVRGVQGEIMGFAGNGAGKVTSRA